MRVRGHISLGHIKSPPIIPEITLGHPQPKLTKQTVSDNPIPVPDNEQLELISQPQEPREVRKHHRRAIIHEAFLIMCYVHMVIARYYCAHQAPSCHALLNIELRLVFFLNEMLSLSTDEAIDRGLEKEIWCYVG
ncbi:hypothetical protein N7519_001528 [Penicillium mononematosum]|uniref:uncharacterized protein n=1 Tax=Penicillium mononematosum TaxID=268346 RepID=UPI002548932B|nr:uncharacterized protein N7519_001528 [Penicillium mononematosum]KAJ6191507.1 hypothetical protein N7519_001528 [Penicillium mononematosum]